MKKTFKLSIVMLCVLMFFASCAGAPETKIPGENVMEHLDGTSNGDGTVTLKGPSGVVVDQNGFLVGSIDVDGSITVGGKTIKPEAPTSEDTALIEATFALCGLNEDFTGKIEEKTVDGYVSYMVLVKEGVYNGVTYNAFRYGVKDNPDIPDGDAYIFASLTMEGKVHTVIVNKSAIVIDGKLTYISHV